MGIFSRLPKPGHEFRTKQTVSSFARKLKSITRYGELKNLQDNLDAIINAFDKYEYYIKRGGLSLRQRYQMWRTIKKADKNISKNDEREIKKLIAEFKK